MVKFIRVDVLGDVNDVKLCEIWSDSRNDSYDLRKFIVSHPECKIDKINNSYTYEFNLNSLRAFEKSLEIDEYCKNNLCSYYISEDFNKSLDSDDMKDIDHYRLHDYIKFIIDSEKYIIDGLRVIGYC